ncbi:MAG: hypothetical protein OXI40_00720 [Chloroflexota bacterium]|nr:hypothetical protein [Chloroflexota bacterium]
MTTIRLACALMLILAFITACSDTGNTSTDALSAQRLLPNLADYTATDVDTTIDGAFAAVGGAALVGGQIGITAFVAKAEQILQCFQDRGALAAKFYSKSQPGNAVPQVGAVLVINQSRINQEMINCALGGQEESLSAQSLNIEPCASAGTIGYQGDTISYVYAGSHPDVCALYQLHFDNLAKQTSAESAQAES